MQQDITIMGEIHTFVEDLYEILQQCSFEQDQMKVIKKVDRKKTKQINRNTHHHKKAYKHEDEENQFLL